MTRGADIDAFVLGFGLWTEDGLDGGLQLAVLDAEADWREGGWDALQHVLRHVDGGALAPPECDDDLPDYFRAMMRLGWVEAAPSAEDELDAGDVSCDSGVDRLLLRLGGWCGPGMSDEDLGLAATVFLFEAEQREAEWAALEFFLSHPERPVEPPSARRDVYLAMWKLGWLATGDAAPQEGEGDAP